MENEKAPGEAFNSDGVWDSLTANQATGNILELMGIAAPVTETDYAAFNSAATYTKGTYVKETIHGDNGRTQPSVASLLKAKCEVIWLDVGDIHAD